MRTAIKPTAYLDAMSDDAALAMLAYRSDCLYGTFEAVEGVPCAGRDQLKTLVVFVAANFAFGHMPSSSHSDHLA